MSDISDVPAAPVGNQDLMDELLRAGVPEIKLALGEAIDRENSRPLPAKYARLLPETLLVVTLRADAGAALAPIAADLERELTDSCNRHGSLYDRAYKVQLQRTDDPDASLYTVSAHAGKDVGSEAPGSGAAAAPAGVSAPQEAPVWKSPSAPMPAPPPVRPAPASLPVSDPDATRLGAEPARAGWEPGRWLLVVEGEGGVHKEVFRLGDATVIVGRRTSDPVLQATIAISDAPHVSRRQLALAWEPRAGAAGFRVYNLGLNDIHLPATDIPGAHLGKEAVDLKGLPEKHTGWMAPGVPLRIGEHGPVLRIEDVPPDPDDEWVDPDATVFE